MENTITSNSAVQGIQGDTRNNNFTVIRMIATVFVFAGHMGIILGGSAPLLGSYGLHHMGVTILFLMSGYLITMSWLSDPNPLRFGIRRFFRLWPPFAVMILIMVFITGPLLSNLGIFGYFQNGYGAYLKNLRFFIVYNQPGVFTDLPAANVVNGSLWTMPVEAGLYIVTPLLLTLMRTKYRSKFSLRIMAAVTVLACGLDLVFIAFFPGKQIVFYGVDLIAAYHLIVFYIIGMLFTYDETKKYLNIQIGCSALCGLLLFQRASEPMQFLMLYLIMPYFIFSLAFAPSPVFSKWGNKVELSYGIYLYGFFFQQLVVSWGMKYGYSLSYMKAFLLSGLLTVIAAFLSYYLVEKPSIQLSRYLVRKLKEREREKSSSGKQT